ncbi:branched-chain amino acid ABC transporter permease [Nocardia goodfellowii]|uniref:Branched-chain amino acid transport system permease protein n=1 Tax=Nocardia goodfellowii TaxID=882446 RepID=A0ABS4QJS0_9NOCA|nr:ABC transporter permease [Nocardia goodfellowii]MBP2191962.1 branched-chain amino acid transport system permease protein [Nocardia goodfellowii]
MEQFLTFGLVGLSTAAIYAVIGSGLVLTYTTTGVFNFAHGAAGMMAAFSYWQLTVGWGVPVALALPLVLLVAAPLSGLVVERAMRTVQRLGEAERLVMTVALLSGLIAAARWIWDPNKARTLPAFFAESAPLRLGSATISWHQALTMAVAVAVAIGLRLLLFRTRTGAEMRAGVDDRALAGLTGADPVRANRVAWILGIELAAIGGILIAPMVNLDAAQLSLLIVSAYTAAVFGRLRSLPMTFLGAVVVGCLESYLAGYLPQNAYLPGLRLAAPALLLFLALLVFPHGRLRGRDRQLSQVPAPTLRGTLVFGAVVVLFGLVLATVLGESDLISYGRIFAFGVIALSFVPLAGYAGQLSLCQLSMAGIGAIAYAHLGPHGQAWALPAAVLIAAAAGAVIALPALRLSGVYLALGTAAFAVVLDRWIFTLPAFDVLGVRIALFDQGSIELTGPGLWGARLDTTAEITVFAAVCLALAGLGVVLLRRGRFGRRLIALRDSEAAYATLGGNLLLAKVSVFALSAGIAGLGGALYGMQLRSVTAEQFNFVAGLPIFLVAVFAGLGAIGTGLFVGVALFGPLTAIPALWPSTHNIVEVVPALAGIAFGGGVVRAGAVARMRAGWDPVFWDRPALGLLLGVPVLLWLLRLAEVIDGWVLFWGSLIAALAVRSWARSRQRPRTEPDVPVEWWGVRRPWRTQDREVLDHAVTTAG